MGLSFLNIFDWLNDDDGEFIYGNFSFLVSTMSFPEFDSKGEYSSMCLLSVNLCLDYLLVRFMGLNSFSDCVEWDCANYKGLLENLWFEIFTGLCLFVIKPCFWLYNDLSFPKLRTLRLCSNESPLFEYDMESLSLNRWEILIPFWLWRSYAQYSCVFFLCFVLSYNFLNYYFNSLSIYSSNYSFKGFVEKSELGVDFYWLYLGK